MTPILAQADLISLGTNWKTWIVAIGGLVLSLIVGRFVQAFKGGMGIKGALAAVWLGINVPSQKQADAIEARQADKTAP